MKTFKEKTVTVLDNVYCDVCGLNCTTEQFGSEYATLEALWGYGSRRDGEKFDIHICQDCFDDALNWMIKQRKDYLGIFKYPYEKDPFIGEK